MTGTSGFKGSGITDPFQTPDAPTVDSVSAGVLSASVSFTAPADTGGGAITSYVASAKQSDGTSVSGTGTSSPINITLTAGGTTNFAVQAFNTYGAGQFSGYGNATSVLSGQQLYSWGIDSNGQLGQTTQASLSSPVQIGSDTDWSSIGHDMQGAEYVTAIKTDGTLYSWGGNNANGELGHNDVVAKSSPTQVGALTTWSDSSTGRKNLLLAKTDGTLWSIGDNLFGQLGINTGNTDDRSSPVQVGSDTNWSRVACGGEYFSIALTTTGELYGFGYNIYGQLGDNTNVRRSSPVQVGAESDWATMGTLQYSCSAIKTDGTFWSWGYNNNGMIGDNTTIRRSSPVQVGALTNWSKVSGSEEAWCAIKTDGTLWSCGRGTDGQLGTNSVVDRSSPVQIGSNTNWSKVSAGKTHFVALTTTGEIYAWGNLDSGQGNNDLGGTVRRSSPVQIGALTSWTDIEASKFSVYGAIGV